MAGCLSIRLAVYYPSLLSIKILLISHDLCTYYDYCSLSLFFFLFLFFLIFPNSRLSLLEEETNCIFCHSMLSHRCTIFFSFVSLISIHIEDGKMVIFNVICVFLSFSFVLHPFFVRSSLPLVCLLSLHFLSFFPYVSLRVVLLLRLLFASIKIC